MSGERKFDFFAFFNRLVDSGIWSLLSPSEKGVLMVILRYTDSYRGQAYPSLAKISEKSGVCRSRVQIAISGLVNYGLIKKGWFRHGKGKTKLVFTPGYLPEDCSSMKSQIVTSKNPESRRAARVSQIVKSLSSHKLHAKQHTVCNFITLNDSLNSLNPPLTPPDAPPPADGSGVAGGKEENLGEGKEKESAGTSKASGIKLTLNPPPRAVSKGPDAGESAFKRFTEEMERKRSG
jgi:hypothetical protein